MTIQANFPAIKPSLMLDFANTKQLDSRITYTRASTASYYDGVTTSMAEQNLITQSQTFSTWSSSGASVTANTTTAPDGTSTGTSLIEFATSANHNIFFTAGTVGLTYTQTVYAKANTRNWLKIINYLTYANFDLTNGVIGSYNTSGVPTITSVGNGWYRCTMSLTTSGASYMQLSIGSGDVANYNDSYTGDGTSGIYIWGAQLENRSSASAYTATTTQAITNYIPKLQSAASGVARFDNNPTTGESLGLLIEESRTNLQTYSSDYTNAIWTKTNATITADTVVAPDGTLTGDKIVESTATGSHRVYGNVTATAAAYTFTFYAKAAGRNFVYAGFTTGAVQYAYFDLVNGTVGTVDAGITSTSITSVGNGWYRCSITRTATATTYFPEIGTASANGTSSFAGDGFSGVSVWGAQVELGAFATSYIPTVASQVTRAADSASMTGTNFSTWYNTGSGSYYVEAATQITTGTVEAFIQDQSISIGVQGSGGNLRVSSTPAQGNLINTLGTAAYPSTSKIGVSYQQGTSLSLASGNGATAGTFTYPQSFATSFGIGTAIAGGGFGAKGITGYIKKVAYYPVALTATNLQALTS